MTLMISKEILKPDEITPFIEEIYERRTKLSQKEKIISESISDHKIVALFNTLAPCENKVIRLYLKGLSVTTIAGIHRKSIKTISAQKQSAMKSQALIIRWPYLGAWE